MHRVRVLRTPRRAGTLLSMARLTAFLIMCVALAGCSDSTESSTSSSASDAFCDPTVRAYEAIGDGDVAQVKAMIAVVAGAASELEEISQATVVATTAELQVRIGITTWSTADLVGEINRICAATLPVYAGG